VPAAPGPAGAADVGSALSPQGSAAPAALAATERTVRLAFDRESWVEVRDGRGKLIFSQLNPPGSSQVVQGEAPLSLVVGNAHGVRVAYQDKHIDLTPFTRVDVARLTLE
jgi:cytoskeleton protein RodZ